ncbi:phage tail protein [Tautonia plasticadhaerens]|uniref:Tip attachment protein J domain-containing protein n=1 Tax=Tautonia plasticadhaerens TaxID=2527974 RepID=A0A518H233_9BACT|nr:phage tail protein [Tautonia plasticadhaerens]QDV34893.1 hypothetical protein ElP_27900 [Tautonia plasticadhaerens]
MKRLLAALLVTSALTAPAFADPVTLTAAVAGAAVSASVAATPAFLLAGGAFAGLGLSTAFLGSIAGAVVATGINFLGSKALAKKPKGQNFQADAAGRVSMIRSSVESHKIIYGQARVSGPIVFITTTSSGPDSTGATVTGDNKFLHMVLPLAGHEVEEIGTLYLNDAPVTVGGDWVTSSPYAKQVEKTDTRIIAVASATRTYTTRNSTLTLSITTSAAHGLSVGQSIELKDLSDRSFAGRFVVSTVSSPTSIVCSVSNAAYAADASATGGNISVATASTQTQSYVRVSKHNGAANQTADTYLMAEAPEWTADHRLQGIAYAYLRFEFNADVFPTGIPNVSFLVKGKKLYDPRTGVTSWSDNWALCVRDYLYADYGFNCQPDEINDSYFIAAANIADEPVNLYAGGTQARYTCNGVVDTATAPLENLSSLLTAGAGAVTYVQGQFRIHAAAYDSPSGEIGLDMLAGDVQMDARPSRKELFNAVKGTYVDPNKQWQPTDFPAMTNATYEAQDGGERIFRDIELPFTTNAEAAQRIAKIIQEKGRQGIRVTIPVNHSALKHAVYDVVTLTNAQLGWTAKPFRILKWSMGVPGPILLELQEESSASYSWNFAEAHIVDAAPDTTLPSVFTVQPPGAVTITEEKYITRTGDGVKVRAIMDWGASPDGFLREYQPEYKLKPEVIWRQLSATKGVTATIEDIQPGEYDFRVKALNQLGVSSDYSTSSRQISGLLDAPQEPQNLTIATIGGMAYLYWDQTPDVDVRIGGKIVIRHSSDTGATWNQTISIGNPAPGAAACWAVPLKPGVYLLKAVDSSGIESAAYASVTADQATALTFANLTTLTEDPTFSGTKTGVIVDSGALKLTGAGEFDSIPDFDAVADLDAYGGTSVTGTYLFSGAMDLGSVKAVRLTGEVVAAITQIYDQIDSRSDSIDNWASFDGTDAAAGDARIYVRQTDDNPAGTPTWGAWQRLDSGEFFTRAFQFMLEMAVDDPTYNISVTSLSVHADEVT